MKKIIVTFITVTICTIMAVTASHAVVMLSPEEALKKMFPDVDEVVTKSFTLTAEEVIAVKEKLGGAFVHYQAGSQSDKVDESTAYDFYVGMKNNQPVRVAIIEEQPGKWGPVEFIIAIDTANGNVNNLAVMSYQEKRGRPIARQNFLKQFMGKGSTNSISVRGGKGIKKDIRAISGATISSDCACFAVRKVIALYENVFTKRYDVLAGT